MKCRCPKCDGTGIEADRKAETVCPVCDGTGTVCACVGWRSEPRGRRLGPDYDCDRCAGTGRPDREGVARALLEAPEPVLHTLTERYPDGRTGDPDRIMRAFSEAIGKGVDEAARAALLPDEPA
ncbi:MAG: hypothetical protein CL819_09025 [Croceicoccus sp.]|nr:hypothetical protein [Croceicoccus sp.]